MILATLSPPVGRALALTVLVVLVLFCWQGLVQPAFDLRHAAEAELEAARAVEGRLAAIVSRAEQAEQRLDALAGDLAVRADLLRAGSEAVAGAMLQQELQSLAQRAGAQVRSAQALPLQREGELITAANRLRLSADQPALIELLAMMDAHSPALRIRQIAISVTTVANEPERPRLDIQMEVEALARVETAQ
ncbi:type II secretion system protein GspM [Indioceanicola profundi]|uniref:type II secretion system protein GspM n=1 Tax=Indioceanicola profundi TaxID=2220096 RepID=UPI000E6ADE93|nr:type II secretion system protein GspM [Indioceanicola profundi]